TGVYYITQADIDAGHFYNMATADSDESGPDDDEEDVMLPKNPSIDIEKLVNEQDADTAPGVMVVVGDAVTFKFIVTNTGNTTLNNVTITDDTYGSIATIASLAPGAFQTFTLNKYAEEYQHTNIATVTTNEGATDSDAGNYYGQPGDEGLSPGYWKNHEEDWVCWDPDDNIRLMFPDVTKWYRLDSQTLMETLERKIKQTESNAPSILLRQAVAAVLNACHPNINYPKSAEWIISAVTHELNDGTYASMLVLAGQLDIWNNLEGDISK
ncbi:MAG: hypothetical protein KBB09_02260, partial [Firmicutes bacterium]|nr:hypothetical protein [Bacillota bacterium]